MAMAPPRDHAERVTTVIVHGGAGANPTDRPDELRDQLGKVRAFEQQLSESSA